MRLPAGPAQRSAATIGRRMSQSVCVLGGGLAGLSCAYELARHGVEVTVLEREPQPGGMATSFVEEFDGERWSYDFGPHRFHTTDPELIEHVQLILAGNHHQAQRLSRIVLFDRFFDYPLKAGNVLRNLPRRVLVRSFLDYFWVRFTERTGLSHHSDENFEGWVVKRFGRTLYELFFGRYTGKAWKMAPEEISGDWASQRISLLSLADTVKQTLRRSSGDTPRTLVSSFIYPRNGGDRGDRPGLRPRAGDPRRARAHRRSGHPRARRGRSRDGGRLRRDGPGQRRGGPLHLDDPRHHAGADDPPGRAGGGPRGDLRPALRVDRVRVPAAGQAERVARQLALSPRAPPHRPPHLGVQELLALLPPAGQDDGLRRDHLPGRRRALAGGR